MNALALMFMIAFELFSLFILVKITRIRKERNLVNVAVFVVGLIFLVFLITDTYKDLSKSLEVENSKIYEKIDTMKEMMNEFENYKNKNERTNNDNLNRQ